MTAKEAGPTSVDEDVLDDLEAVGKVVRLIEANAKQHTADQFGVEASTAQKVDNSNLVGPKEFALLGLFYFFVLDVQSHGDGTSTA